jgi:hypothetical protein
MENGESIERATTSTTLHGCGERPSTAARARCVIEKSPRHIDPKQGIAYGIR